MEEVREAQPPDPAGPSPEVADTSTIGGWVWIVLFGTVMAMAVLANLVLAWTVIANRKKHNVVYMLLLFLFPINLLDFSLLVFDFSLGLEHQYPHGEAACSMYQVLTKGNPILQAATLMVLLFYTASNFTNVSSNCGGGCGGTGSRSSALVLFGIMVGGLVLFYGLLALPTAHFATIVTVDEKRYCEIEIGQDGLQRDISLYYLVYSAVLSYWLPLLLSIVPMIKLARSANSDKYPEVSVVLATVSSFFIFYSMHGCVVLTRHTIDAMGITLDTHQSWMIKVAQSLLWLVAYFWHVTRPVLVFLMDSDLKTSCCSPVSYHLVDLSQPDQVRVPLKVLLSPKGEESEANLDDNEAAIGLNNQQRDQETHSGVV